MILLFGPALYPHCIIRSRKPLSANEFEQIPQTGFRPTLGNSYVRPHLTRRHILSLVSVCSIWARSRRGVVLGWGGGGGGGRVKQTSRSPFKQSSFRSCLERTEVAHAEREDPHDLTNTGTGLCIITFASVGFLTSANDCSFRSQLDCQLARRHDRLPLGS